MAGGRINPKLKWATRAFALLNLLNGLGFIIYAIVLENPPKTSLCIGLLIIGIVAMIEGLLGFFLVYCVKCFNTFYLLLGTVITLCQLAIVLSMFFNADTQVRNLCLTKYPKVKTCPPNPTAYYTNAIEIGRIYFLIVVIIQIISLIIAVIVRFKNPVERDYEDFEQGHVRASAQAQIQMEHLRNSIMRNGSTPERNESIYTNSGTKSQRSLNKKMTEKYGSASHVQFEEKWYQKFGFTKK